MLEPSCGDGAFSLRLPGCVAIEPDRRHAPPDALNMDFFAYPESEQLRHHRRQPALRALPGHRRIHHGAAAQGRLRRPLQPLSVLHRQMPAPPRPRRRADLHHAARLPQVHLERAAQPLAVRGRDDHGLHRAGRRPRLRRRGAQLRHLALRSAATSAAARASWTCRSTSRCRDALAAGRWEAREFLECAGHLLFTREHYPLRFSDLFFVKVGAVSGDDEVFASEEHGTLDFVCSRTAQTGELRRMIYNRRIPYLEPFREAPAGAPHPPLRRVQLVAVGARLLRIGAAAHLRQ
ncbi:MAG: hypothetical protein MZW92_77235 [Comamonadaceae bacterium]|nr:hypothetical protein [Comamonadaceae bacterium]